MATTALPPQQETNQQPTTIFRRPTSTEGFWGWVTTTDHKKIGIMYGYTAFVFFILGGVMALLLRVQLAVPDNDFLSAAEYNAMFTMHATTMIFLFVMPMAAAFFNYLLPLMIGARDVAFPRMNAVSYWIFLFGAIFLSSSFVFGTSGAPVGGNLPGGAEFSSRLGSGPNGGWFGYAPNSLEVFSTGTALDYWSIGLQVIGIASLISSVNFIVTILNLRAKGMKLLRMPVFVWMTFVVAFLLLFSLPIIAVALFMITFDRQFGTIFFDATAGGDPVLWQHLFWLFGHPEVYILILPSMGLVSEVLPTFSRKPLFGYAAVVFAGAAIAFLGFGVWAHHMYASGITPVAQAAFGLATMTIAVPTGIKIFNWLGTMWGGKIRFSTPMLFAIGFVSLFVIGGLSGVTHSIVPSNWQQTDTYYIVAHFHYVLFGGAVFGLFAGLYYYFPMLTGRMFSERLGKLHFWLMFIGMNLTFGPMHWMGLQGMPRRTWVWFEEQGLGFWNTVVTVGAFIIAASALVFMINWAVSRRRGERVGFDPWDARTLEWMLPLPVPAYNFAKLPTVRSLDEFWHRKYREDADGRAVKRDDYDEIVAQLEEEGRNPTEEIELPSPSYFPFLVGLGIMFIAYGVVYLSDGFGFVFLGLGAITMLGSFVGWSVEPLEEPHPDHDDHGPDDGGDAVVETEVVEA
jgi:cytochrome c oxidase subunit 1